MRLAFVFVLVFHPFFLYPQIPKDREIEAEQYLNRLYRIFGPPGSPQLEESLGHENVQMIFQRLTEGTYTTLEADSFIVDILKERGLVVVEFYLPPAHERFQQSLQAQSRTPQEDLYLRNEPLHRFPIRSNPLIDQVPAKTNGNTSTNQNQGTSSETARVALSGPSVSAQDQAIRTSETASSQVNNPPTQPPTPPQRPPVVYTLQDLAQRLGPIGIQTSGGGRNQYPSLIFPTEDLIKDLESVMNRGGRLEVSNRPRAAFALIQLLLLSSNEELGEDGIDGVNAQGKVSQLLQRFQTKKGLRPTGNLDNQTLQELLTNLLRPIRS